MAYSYLEEQKKMKKLQELAKATNMVPRNTLPSKPKTLPSIPNSSSRINKAVDRANQVYINSLPTESGINRTNNILKGAATSTVAAAQLMSEASKQSLSDWQDKVKTQGLQSAMYDYAYNLDNPNYTFGKPIDTNSKAYQSYAKSQGYYDKAMEGLSPAQQKAGRLGISILENAATLPTALINPSAPLLIMGTKAAANKTYDLTNQGKTATEAAGRGLLSGAIEAGTEKLPLENLIRIAKTGGKSAVKNVLQQMGTEGTEELASYIMNYAADVSSGDETAKFSPSEALGNFAGGAISGGVMGGLGSVVGNYTDSRMDNYKNNAPTLEDYRKIQPLPDATLKSNANVLPSVQSNPQPLNKTQPVNLQSQAEKSSSNMGIVNPDVQALFDDAGKAKSGLKSAYQSIASGWAPFERMSKVDTDSSRNIAARVNKYAQKGGTTDTILTRGLYDRNGNKVSDKSFISVASQVPKADIPAFNDYWQNLHNIDRQVQGKPVNANTAEQSQNIVAQYELQHPEFKEYKKAISDYWDSFVQTWLVGDIISADDYAAMKKIYPNYVPTFRVEDGASGGGGTVNAGKKIIGGKAIGKVKGSTAEVMSFEESFAKKIQSIVGAATKNDISREVYSFAKDMPEIAAQNGILLNTKDTSTYNNQSDLDEYIETVDKNIAKEINKDNFEITFYENGKARTMKINRDVYEAFRFLDSKLGDNKGINTFANLGRFFTNKMRALTTTYNPLFFMTNIMRDIQTYTINNTAKNSAVAAKNYVKAIVGMAKQAETYNQYKALGGSQNGYIGTDMYKNTVDRINPNKTVLQKALSIPKAPLTAMEKLGEVTETIPRYAEYLNTTDRLGNTETGRLQASLNAADVTVNFNRSGTISTLANAWIPYFNAGLQGMDKTVRQFKAQPVKTTTRAAISVFLPTLLLYLVNKDNDNWKNVKDGVRDNYYLIPNMAGPLDEKGNAETFIRLPKSREYGALMSASFERFTRAVDDEIPLSDAFNGYGQTLLNSFMPPDLNDWIGGATRAIKENKAWHGGTIVPTNLTKVSPQYQYDINTSGAAMNVAKLGQKLPLPGELGKALSSPMKVDYILDSYTGYAGDVLQGLTSQRNKGRTGQETALNSVYSGLIQPFKNRLSTDSAFSSYTLDNFYNQADKAEIAKNDKNYGENLPSDYVTAEETVNSAYDKAQSVISDLTKQEKAVLASAAPIKDKNEQIRKLRQQKNAVAKEMLSYPQTLTSAYNSVYLPAVGDINKLPAYKNMSEEDKNKAMAKITEYASDVAKDKIYPNSYYPNYETPKYLNSIKTATNGGANLGDAIFYRYMLNKIDSEGGNNSDKRNYLAADNYLSSTDKNVIDDAFITDFTYIPKEVNADYSTPTSTVLTQMSDAAQRKWTRFEDMGLSIDDYVNVYKAATSGTKDERLANLQALGYSYSDAYRLYKAATKR